MIDTSKIEAIYVWSGPTDMRKGVNGLVGLAQSVIEREQMAHRLFIFCGRNKRNIKILEVDYDGYWLYQKVLVTGKFQWPKTEKGNLMIDRRQLDWLLQGLSMIQPKAHENVFYPETK